MYPVREQNENFKVYDNNTFIPDGEELNFPKLANGLKALSLDGGDSSSANEVLRKYKKNNEVWSSSCKYSQDSRKQSSITHPDSFVQMDKSQTIVSKQEKKTDSNKFTEAGLFKRGISTPFLKKSLSHDCEDKSKPWGRRIVKRSCSDSAEMGDSFSSTIDEDTVDTRRKKFQQRSDTFHSSFSSNTSLSKADEFVDEDFESITKTAKKSKEKVKSKNWLRKKLPRYATFDESNVYVSQDPPFTDIFKGETEENVNTKPLKGLSLIGRLHGRKLECNYSLVKNDYILHETSRRLPTLKESRISLPLSDENENHPETQRKLQRCSSVPDFMEPTKQCNDETLDDLYLPRRMAICPGLRVPAMKQLKTYLVVTRLQQYCLT